MKNSIKIEEQKKGIMGMIMIKPKIKKLFEGDEDEDEEEELEDENSEHPDD